MPAPAGVQGFQHVMDSHFRGNDIFRNTRGNCKSIQQRDCSAALAKTNGVYAVIARSVATKQSQ